MIKQIYNRYKNIFLSAIFVAYILYSSIVNFDLWNPDSLNRSIYIKDLVWVNQMRWANQLWETYIRSYYILPELTLFINCVLIAAIVVLILDMFNIERYSTQILVMICLVGSVHQVSNMTYAYCGDEFVIAYFLAVLGAWFLSQLWEHDNKNIVILYACICFVISLAMYQAYYSISIMLIALKFIFILMDKVEIKVCIKKVFWQLVILIGSIGAYMASVYISLWAYNTNLSSYRGMDKIGFGIERFINSIKDAYMYIYYYFFTDYLFSNSFRYRKELHIIILSIYIVILMVLIVQYKNNLNITKITLMVVTICVFPIAFDFVHILTDSGVSFMMLPVIPYFYVIGILLIDKTIERRGFYIWGKICQIPMLLAAWTSVLIVLITISELKLDISKIKSVANNLDYVIKSEENYTLDTPVLVVGNYLKGSYPDVYDYAFNAILGGTVHDFGQLWQGEGMGLATFNNWNHIFMRYCGSQYNWCTEEEYNYIISSTEFGEMDVFPKSGSIQYIEDVLVIKLSTELY